MNDPLLRFDNVSKTFGSATGGVRAARSVNFALHSGEGACYRRGIGQWQDDLCAHGHAGISADERPRAVQG
jgi:hypothetical protein